MKRFLLFLSLVIWTSSAHAVTLEQIISREHPFFDAAAASLSIGKDGQVYLGSVGPNSTAYVMRLTRDGKSKFGGSVVYSVARRERQQTTLGRLQCFVL